MIAQKNRPKESLNKVCKSYFETNKVYINTEIVN